MNQFYIGRKRRWLALGFSLGTEELDRNTTLRWPASLCWKNDVKHALQWNEAVPMKTTDKVNLCVLFGSENTEEGVSVCKG